MFCDTGTYAGCGDKSNILWVLIAQIDKFKNAYFWQLDNEQRLIDIEPA